MKVLVLVLCLSAATAAPGAATQSALPDVTSTFTTKAAPTTTEPREQCSQEVSDECPTIDPPIAIHLPNPDDCSSFCECSGGTAYLLHCQDGLYYDTVIQGCNWPAVVDCGSRPEPPQH